MFEQLRNEKCKLWQHLKTTSSWMWTQDLNLNLTCWNDWKLHLLECAQHIEDNIIQYQSEWIWNLCWLWKQGISRTVFFPTSDSDHANLTAASLFHWIGIQSPTESDSWKTFNRFSGCSALFPPTIPILENFRERLSMTFVSKSWIKILKACKI